MSPWKHPAAWWGPGGQTRSKHFPLQCLPCHWSTAAGLCPSLSSSCSRQQLHSCEQSEISSVTTLTFQCLPSSLHSIMLCNPVQVLLGNIFISEPVHKFTSHPGMGAPTLWWHCHEIEKIFKPLCPFLCPNRGKTCSDFHEFHWLLPLEVCPLSFLRCAQVRLPPSWLNKPMLCSSPQIWFYELLCYG